MNFTKTVALETAYGTQEKIKTQLTLLSSTNIWKGVMMKYKLLTIGAASLLPLGFAATASVANPTAEHEVTFTVAEARSISVVVKEEFRGENGELEFGAIGQSDSGGILLSEAVTVTFSTPGDEDRITAKALVEAGGADFPFENSGIELVLTAKTFAEQGEGRPQTLNLATTDGGDNLYAFFEETHLLSSFDVDYTLKTDDADVGAKTMLIQYLLAQAN